MIKTCARRRAQVLNQNLRASTRASFESKLARVDARNLADDLLLCCVLAACCG